jgi:O-antigen ligase
MAVDVRPRRPGSDARWLVLPAALAASALGLVAVLSPLTAIVGVAGLLFAAVAFHDLAAGLALFAVVTFLEALPGGAAPVLGAVKVAGLVLVLSALRRSGTPFLLKDHPAVAYAVTLLAAWALASSLWAVDSSRATSDALRLVLDVMLVFVIFAAVRATRHMRWLAAGYIVGAVTSAFIDLADPAEDAGDRLAGGLGDPNFLAAATIPAIVFSVFAFAATKRPIRWPLASSTAFLTIALFLTESRGGLVALGATLVAALLFAGPARRHFAVLAAAVVSVGLVYYSAFASHAALDRLMNPGRGTGRVDLWSVATRVIGDHPVLGVGAGNFQVVAPEYASETVNLPSVHLVVDEPHVAHSAYLGVFAELGIIGLVAFVLVISACLILVRRSAKAFVRTGDLELELLSRAVFVGLIGMLTALVFLSGQYEKQLWLLLGFAVALYGLARRRAQPGPPARRSSTVGP